MLIRYASATLISALPVSPVFAQSDSAGEQDRTRAEGMQDRAARSGAPAWSDDARNERATRRRANAARIEKMTEGWPEPSRKAIQVTSEKYGPPAALTPELVLWNRAGPWKRTVVYREAVPPRFPMPHVDVLQQGTDHQAPPEKYDDLAMYDGSVVLARTVGEIPARCDKEAANFLALNLAHEVATGKRSVEEAGKVYGGQVKAMMDGKPAPYTEKLMLPTGGDTRSPDGALPGM